jgi:hypothetical protein
MLPATAERLDPVRIHVSKDQMMASYQQDAHLPFVDPLIKSFCRNCNLVLSEPELMTFVENFYKSVRDERSML